MPAFFLKLFTTGTLVALTLVLAACQAPRSLDTRYYLLTATAGADTTAGFDHTIGVGPVAIAAFLDRPGIVIHGDGGEIRLSDGRRWAEPLDEAIQRVLSQNLASLTGAPIRGFPWRRSAIPDYAIRVEVLDLNRPAGGSAELEVTWEVEDPAGNRLLHSGRERFRAQVDGEDYSALARAYSALLAQFSRRLADQLASVQD